MIKATHIYTEKYNTKRKLALRLLKALKDIQDGLSQGTIKSPYELASSVMPDGRTLVQTVYEDKYIRYNDGFYIVEVDEICMYVDITSFALKELDINNYPVICDIND